MTIEGIGRITIAVLVLFGVEAQTALSQDSSTVTVNVAECVNLKSSAERLACYGRQVDAARSVPATETLRSGESADGGASPQRGEATDEGVGAAAPNGATEDSQEFVATVTSLQRTVPNSYIITLDNGQVWRQTYAERYPLRLGLRVKIRPSRFGRTYWLSAEQHRGYIQVMRVR